MRCLSRWWKMMWLVSFLSQNVSVMAALAIFGVLNNDFRSNTTSMHTWSCHSITCYEDCYLYIHSVWTASRQDPATFTTGIIKAIWHLDEGDIMNAPEFVPVGNDCWDATFVHVSVSPPYYDYLSHIMVSMWCSLIRMYGTQIDQWCSNQQFSLVNNKIFSWLAWKHLQHSSLTKNKPYSGCDLHVFQPTNQRQECSTTLRKAIWKWSILDVCNVL